jgi:hypothetical protein
MKPFCEVIVADVLPVIRAMVAKELMVDYKMSQVEVARKLGVTQPAISQYRSKLRGQSVKLLQSNKKVVGLIKNLAKEIATGRIEPQKMHQRLCAICRTIRMEKIICKMHGGVECYICFGKQTC